MEVNATTDTSNQLVLLAYMNKRNKTYNAYMIAIVKPSLNLDTAGHQ
jgi:hypothetical protein